MRISDWSSDVCSSDLPGGSRRTGRAAPALPCSPARVSSRSCAFIRTRRPSTGTSATPSPRRTPRRHSARRAFRPRAEKRDEDRKSVGQGKDVSGRVDRGGGRIYNKKKNKKRGK